MLTNSLFLVKKKKINLVIEVIIQKSWDVLFLEYAKGKSFMDCNDRNTWGPRYFSPEDGGLPPCAGNEHIPGAGP